jgi:hypothetical protein
MEKKTFHLFSDHLTFQFYYIIVYLVSYDTYLYNWRL